MTSEERDQLVNAIEAALALASGTTTDNVYAFFARSEPWVRNSAELLGRVQSRESLIALLDQLPPELDAFMPLATSFIPLIPAMAVKDAKQALRPAAEALAAGTAGRPNTVSEEMKPDIVNYISEVERRGADRRPAQRRAAQHFGISLRSVQRVWRERKQYSEKQPASISQVIENIGSLGPCKSTHASE